MGWWKADPEATVTPSLPAPETQTPPPAPDSSACPVDPKTRSIWLQQAQSRAQKQPDLPASHPPIPRAPQQQQQPPPPPPSSNPLPGSSLECSSDRISQSPTHPPTTTKTPRPLSQERAISSIPRTIPSPQTPTPSSTPPSNAETETGPHPSGNWIYPSETQFFNAVMSKQTTSDPNALLSSISHIIPIHNAVNERAWSLVRSWEADKSAACSGPKLHSFSGRGAGALSPKAKWKSWVMGYQEPFDRHDWVVERCGGEKVEYVIDFYQGKQEQDGGRDGKLNFYLDVRPKLNSWEGVRMRAEKLVWPR